MTDDLIARGYCSNISTGSLGSKFFKVSSLRTSKEQFLQVVNSNGKKSDFTFDRITEVFDISKGLDIKTMGTVTRMCSRNAANIPMNRRYTTNDRILRYTRMLEDLFMDTIFATFQLLDMDYGVLVMKKLRDDSYSSGDSIVDFLKLISPVWTLRLVVRNCSDILFTIIGYGLWSIGYAKINDYGASFNKK